MTETPTTPLPPHRDPWAASPPPGGTGTGASPYSPGYTPGGTHPTPWEGDGGAGQWPPSPVPAAPAPGARRRRPAAALAATAVLAALLGGGAGAVTATVLDDPDATSSSGTAGPVRVSDTGTVVPAEGTTAEVAAEVLPSVVMITAASGQGQGTGSGVVLDDQGHILTNNHVVEGAASGGRLTVSFQDGHTSPATMVGTDPSADLAVIRVQDTDGLTPIALGSSADLQVGDGVLAVGSPLGLAGTVTEGIVSAKNRPVLTAGEQGGQGSVLNAIQTDTAINPGNSGGALVDMQGRLVGINSAIATLGGGQGQRSGSIGLGFAVPIDQAKRIADELIEDGTATYARLGAQVGDAPEGGAQLGPIEPGTAAASAGLAPGDVVSRFAGQVVGDADSLVAAVRSAVPGSTVELQYVRDGETRTAQVTLETVESD